MRHGSSLGARKVRSMRRALLDTLAATGGLEAVRMRRVPEPR
jgi:hypothetical protein